MRCLLDANVLIWALYEPERLSQRIQDILAEPDAELVLSHATLWEVLSKLGRGNLLLGGETVDDARRRIEELELEMLAITEEHILASVKLPRHHNDPFDRLLIAQANQEAVPILSSDRLLPRYEVSVIWD